MSDLFISYARQDRGLAESLAEHLRHRGFSVWWDAELVGSDNFQDVILAALSRAKAAIVIWTKHSVVSNFVRDEARYALFHKKLIATRAPDVDILEIPFGFQSQHTEDVGSRDNIVRAIEKLGVQTQPKHLGAVDSWEQIRNTRDSETLLAWIGENASHPQHIEAVALLRGMLEGANAAGVVPNANERIVRRSKVEAFFRGLAFQLPAFQLSEEGRWSSVGMVITLSAVFLSAVYVWVGVILNILGLNYWPYYLGWLPPKLGFGVFVFHTLLSVVLSYAAINKWADQRNFKALVITFSVFIVSAVELMTGICVLAFLILFVDLASPLFNFGLFLAASFFAIVIIGFLLPTVYFRRKFTRLR